MSCDPNSQRVASRFFVCGLKVRRIDDDVGLNVLTYRADILGPNTKRFKRTLVNFNTDTEYANFRENPLYQATKRPKTMKNERKRLVLV